MKKFIGFAATGIIAFLCVMMFFAPSVEIDTVYEDAQVDYGECENHLYGNNNEYTYVGEATCSSTATKYRTCIVCGFIEKIVIPKDPENHANLSEFVTYDPKPTCASGGVQYRLCYACNQQAEVTILAADPNSHVSLGDYVVVTPETCSTAGEKAHKCRYCKTYFDNETIPVDSSKHVVGENATWIVIKLPTCSTAGEMIACCDLCGVHAETRVVPATNKHTPGNEWVVDSEPTCSSDGIKSRHCSVCDMACDKIVIRKDENNHSFDDEFTTDKTATCISTGSKSKHCIYCDAKTEVTEIPTDNNAHEYGNNWVVTQEPTCAATGLKHRVCSLCKKNSVSTIIEKNAHTYPVTYEVIRMSEDELSAIVKYNCKDCDYEYVTVVVFGENNGTGDMGDGSTPENKVFEIIPVENTVIKVDHTNFIISNVARHMLVDDFVAKFKNGSVYVIYNEYNDFKSEAEFIGTGCRLNFETIDGNVTNYYVSVTGDMDSDGKVSASDARLVLRAAARLDNPEGAYFTAADVNLDGKITAADARKTLLVAANIEFFENTYEH